MADLTQKVILVTGSTKGIGYAIAYAFVEEGGRVIVHGRDPGQVKQSQDALGTYAGVSGELGSASGCQQVLDQLTELDQVEVLINNAGIFSVEDFFAVDDDEWLRYFQTNVLSAVRLCRELMPSMLENNRGRIINVASEAGVKPLPLSWSTESLYPTI